MAPKVAVSRIPNLRTIFPMKGMKGNMGSIATITNGVIFHNTLAPATMVFVVL